MLGLVFGLGQFLSTETKYLALDLASKVRFLAFDFGLEARVLVLVLGLEAAKPASTYKYIELHLSLVTQLPVQY